MGRPEPCVLFSQSFIHPHLDEYVDEVIFAEPIVISACEFLEQNASSSSPMITLVGATSPPSFALEVFVQSEGEPRFRRLCQPFLYSHSSSNVLEVEAVVTNHLVVRGSYRSLTLVVYGNTAEDLGQFNIEFDLDNSLANLVCSPAEGKLEDLPPALNLSSLTFEQSMCSPKSLSLPVAEPDLSVEMKQFLHLTLKICQLSDHEDTIQKLASIVALAVSSYVSSDLCGTMTTSNQHKQGRIRSPKRESERVLTDARNELLELYKMLQQASVNAPDELLGEGILLESAVDLPTPELLVDVFNHCFLFKRKSPTIGLPLLSQNENMIVGLSVVLLSCSGRESCFHFVNGGGMEQLAHFFSPETHKSTAITLMLLGVVEHATRYAIGCEGFLGWWPREDENVPIGSSEGYSQLLKLLLQKQRHDVASLATYILHRLRSYEIASRYESAILSVLGNLSAVGRVTGVSLNSLATANSQLKRLLKLLNLRGPIEDPSPVSSATRSLILAQSEGLLSYGATINLIASSKYCFSNWDIDTHLLSLLKERGFLPLSAALLSSPVLRSEIGRPMDIFVDIAASIEAILLSLLFCRSGLIFLLLQPEVSAACILSLQGVEDVDKAECVPLRYAAVLISKGFICRVQEIGVVTDLHLRVVNAIDRLLAATPHSEELLWVLWELCALSRSDSGRQAVLALAYFPEAVVVLMETVRSIKELQPAAPNHGTSPLGLAIFHLASELFEIMVTDSTSSSLFAWIGHAVELHKALHSSSPGSNRKDAPTRLLEWIDAGVVYHKNGAVGLLRYAAVLASGGDAQLTSTSILVSDSMDVEKVVGDSASGSDVQVESLLGKLVSDKFFDGVPLRDSSIAQLTTTFRILAFISENSAVAAALYEEGAVTLIYVVLVNCKSMLERYSNSYDYLVDEGAESNSTSDLLLERSREQSLIDLMIPSLVLLITLLLKLQEAKEQHRNTKLLNALLRLHREVSPKLAARAADSSSPYPCSALGLGAVCRLIVSALACWPVFSWTPGLFHCLLESVQVTSSLALGPKEACSLLCLLGDLFPEEGIWLWKNGMPSLSDLRSLSIATLLGPERERDVDWYLQPGHLSVLLSRLTPLLDKIAQIVLHFAFTALVVIQDLLRVFIIRIACQKVDSALVLLRPIISWIDDHVSKSSVSDKDIFKVLRLLDFVASLSEHPRGKALLLKEGAVGIFIKALQRCIDAFDSDGKLIPESRIPAKSDVSFLSWCFPVFKSLALICDPQTPLDHSAVYDKSSFEKLSIEDCSLIGCNLLKLCQFLPVGRELQACLIAFKELASTSPGRSALASIFRKVQSSSVEDVEAGRGKEVDVNDNLSDEYNWRRCPPLLICWRNLLRSIEAKDVFSVYAIEAVSALCLVASCLCGEGKNLEGVLLLKCLFGLHCDLNGTDDCPEEKLKDVHELLALLDVTIGEDEYSKSPTTKTSLCQVKESVESMLLLLEKPVDSVKVENATSSEGFPSSKEVSIPSKIFSLHSLMPSVITTSTLDDEAGLALSRIRRSEGNAEKAGNYISLGGLADNFLWECPDTSPDRLLMPALPVKRKMTSVESSSRRLRGDNLGPENTGTNAFPRGLGPPTASSGPTRRDTFRQRKPNTSRPPSMHVDDYVARERNVDGASSGSNVVSSVQRGGSTGGRPPSIHVDEFMARQRERQNPVAASVGEAAQVRSSSVENDNDSDKIDRSRQLKADLDDDLQEIDIVFDEESESDDRLPFPQPDDNLLPASVIIGESSPRPIVEESENDINESSQFSHLGTSPATKTDGNLHSDLPLRRSVSRAEMPIAREPSISSEKHYPGMNSEKTFFHEQGDETKHTALLPASKGFDANTATHSPAFPSQFYNKGPISSPVHPLGDSRPTQPAFYQKDSPHQATNVPLATGSQGFYEQKLPVNQPPLPPLPPPPAVSPIPSQSVEAVQAHSSPYGHSVRDALPPLPTVHPLQAFNVSGPSTIPVLHVREDRHGAALLLPSASLSAFSDSLNPPFQPQIHTEYQSTAGTLLATPHPMLESKYSWATISSGSRLQDEANPSTGSGRPPPLPPMPPPYSAPQVTQSSMKSSSSQSPLYNQTSVGIQLPLPSTPLTDSRLGAFSATSVGGSSLSYPLPPFGPPSMVARPTSIPGSLFTTAPMMQQQPSQQGQNTPSLSLPGPNPQPSVQSIQPRPPLQPLQPPLLRPPHLLQHPRLSSIQVSQPQSEQGIPLQHSPIQVQLPPLQQIQQQLPISQMHVYYQPQQQEHLSLLSQQLQAEQTQPQSLHQQGDSALSQQQQDSGMTLQQYFSSPEAIQSLLSDRDKLCQLLEQHPKLMQMLQEKLGQL
ncbi:protein virilizer homolog [Magnolia sinica]|uniref:protein virilizer homolog n=1 Tax=Magnolia sinica TaxID=86752 RepID=UPI002658AE8C|nr:protein virilizer homolog [Magnolia sinica]